MAISWRAFGLVGSNPSKNRTGITKKDLVARLGFAMASIDFECKNLFPAPRGKLAINDKFQIQNILRNYKKA